MTHQLRIELREQPRVVALGAAAYHRLDRDRRTVPPLALAALLVLPLLPRFPLALLLLPLQLEQLGVRVGELGLVLRLAQLCRSIRGHVGVGVWGGRGRGAIVWGVWE